MMPVRECQIADMFKETTDGYLVPTAPSDTLGKKMTILEIDPKKLKVPEITSKHLL